MEILRRIFKIKPKAKNESEEKRTYTKLKDHGTDISYENEIKKPVEKEAKETKETKSSLTFGD